MKTSVRVSFYAFGVITALVVVGGLYFLITTLSGTPSFTGLNNEDLPYTLYFFAAYSVINLIFLGMLGTSAFRLFKLNPSGITLLARTLKLELVYWICISFMWFLPFRLGRSAAGATGIGNMGIAPQVFIAYPITGLFILWLLRICKVLSLEPTTEPPVGSTDASPPPVS